jgi:site-specific DNA recombinase
MIPSHTTRCGTKRYRYYVCSSAQKLGWHTCPSKSIPAGQIEELVVEQIRQLGRDPQLLREVLDEARRRDAVQIAECEAEQRGLERDLRAWHAEMRALAAKVQPHDNTSALIGRLAELQERVGTVEERLRAIGEQTHAIENHRLDEDEAKRVLSLFEPVWASLPPHEQARVVHLLVEQVAYDGSKGKVAITFRPTGIKTLARDLEEQRA